MNKLLKIPMQFFAQDQTADDAGEKPTDTEDKATSETEEKTFTQQDVNNLVARESKAAVEKLLKDAGLSSEGDDYKTSLKAFNEWQDSQKTEIERATEALTTAEKAKQEAEAKAQQLERQISAISKGIPADKADKYLKLAEAYVDDATDFDKAIELALKDFPVAEKGVGGAGGNPAPTGKGKSGLPKGTVIF